MIGEPTGVLDVLATEDTDSKRFTWNGDPVDRAAARAAFDAIAREGGFLAVVVDEPGKATHVRSFDEVELVERERGTVTVQVSRQIVGG